MPGDQFFTPLDIAARMVAAFRSTNERCVADFAAGNGDLLRAARSRWPGCEITATDIDDRKVRLLRRAEPTWRVGKCDFLSPTSRRSCLALKQFTQSASLILLNPPFSCRGNSRHCVTWNGREILCSQAMAFVLTSLHYMSGTGRLAAVLPASTMTSNKDGMAWQCIRQRFSVRVLSSHSLGTFDGCSARTVVVRLNRSSEDAEAETETSEALPNGIEARIIRGVVPVHAAQNGLAGVEWPLVHTTNLRDGSVVSLNQHIRVLRRYAIGPSVLIPRVGQPNREKCALYLRRKRIVLSDCVFALQCKSSGDATTLCETLKAEWGSVRDAYAGTCAKYLTLERLQKLLRGLGIGVSP